jgi:hypothetical protein
MVAGETERSNIIFKISAPCPEHEDTIPFTFDHACPSMKLLAFISLDSRRVFGLPQHGLTSMLLSTSLFFSASAALAQRGGGGGGGGHGAPITGAGTAASGRPDGVDEKDPLKTFHEAMEVQATTDQAAAFRAIVKNTESASKQLTSFEKETDASQLRPLSADLKESLRKVCTQTQNFVNSLSAKQKAGLKETTSRLEKAGAELAEQTKTLDGDTSALAQNRTERTGSLQKALENFRNQQDRLALDMGIVLSDADVAFTIPSFKTSAEISGQHIAISSSTLITRVGADNGENTYKIILTADLSDLEPNLTAALASDLNGGERCGERYSVDDATLSPATGISVVVSAKIYAERWVCSRALGESELAQGSGDADIKATPVVGANGEIEIHTEVAGVQAKGFLADSLHGGTLGTKLQQSVAGLLALAIRATDFRATLPAAGAAAATMQTAKFQSTEVGDLTLILEGEMRIPPDQAEVLGNQLKERLASQAIASPRLQK